MEYQSILHETQNMGLQKLAAPLLIYSSCSKVKTKHAFPTCTPQGRDWLFNCNDLPCSILMLTNNHVST